MCDPVTATVVSVGLSVGSSLYQGAQAKKRAKSNADVLERQAALRQEKARVDIEQADIRARRQAGARDAIIGTSGVSAESFSDIIDDDLKSAALDKQLIKYGADIDSSNIRMKAAQQRSEGKAALFGSVLSAAGSVAAGYGRVGELRTKGVATTSPWATYSTPYTG